MVQWRRPLSLSTRPRRPCPPLLHWWKYCIGKGAFEVGVGRCCPYPSNIFTLPRIQMIPYSWASSLEEKYFRFVLVSKECVFRIWRLFALKHHVLATISTQRDESETLPMQIFRVHLFDTWDMSLSDLKHD